jgi:hypothetical protein
LHVLQVQSPYYRHFDIVFVEGKMVKLQLITREEEIKQMTAIA